MHRPVNFDSVPLDNLLSDWMGALAEFSVSAVAVLGPDPFGEAQDRLVLAVHPPRLLPAAQQLARSDDFNAHWRGTDASLVVWQDLERHIPEFADKDWRSVWVQAGYRSLVRVEFSLPASRAFECFLFAERALDRRTDATGVAWSALSIWPLLRKCIAQANSRLTVREIECLSLAFQGKTAKQTSEMLSCSERTVGFHLANAMNKLKADNKLAAVQRACWIGAL